jgi:hypothetical protein
MAGMKIAHSTLLAKLGIAAFAVAWLAAAFEAVRHTPEAY